MTALSKRSKKQNEFVIVSFGSRLSVDRDWVYQKLLGAFGHFPELKFIVKHKLGENLRIDALFNALNNSHNLLILDWLPQKELLGTKKNFRFQFTFVGNLIITH